MIDVSMMASQATIEKARSKKLSLLRRRAYHCWANIVALCHKETHPSYRYLGGKGIKVCERWRGNFDAFLEDMGHPPDFVSTPRRIDETKDYEPGNVEWGRNEKGKRG